MVGRPKSMDTRKIVSLPAALAQAIEDYRFTNRLKTEAEAIRRLIERGLAADKIPIRKTSAGASGSGSSGSSKPQLQSVATKKPTTRKAPRSKASAMSREAQIRALRERIG